MPQNDPFSPRPILPLTTLLYMQMILYTAVYSHIQIKLWTAKRVFLYTDNLDEIIY